MPASSGVQGGPVPPSRPNRAGTPRVFRIGEAGIKAALAYAGVQSTKRWFARRDRAKGDVCAVSPDLSQVGIAYDWREIHFSDRFDLK
jgi:hypothetical protein